EDGGSMRSEVERLLVVDDEGPILHALQRTFEAAGYEVTACLDPAEALDRLKEKEFQVLSADYMMPGMTGAEFLARARALQPETIRILITAAHDFSAAVDAINNGEIFRILAKPWNRVERFTRRIAEQLGVCDERDLRTIEMGSLLHDIGKIGVRDAVLLKPGPLDQEEWVEMREHPRLGWALLQRIEFLREASEIVLQ